MTAFVEWTDPKRNCVYCAQTMSVEEGVRHARMGFYQFFHHDCYPIWEELTVEEKSALREKNKLEIVAREEARLDEIAARSKEFDEWAKTQSNISSSVHYTSNHDYFT